MTEHTTQPDADRLAPMDARLFRLANTDHSQGVQYALDALEQRLGAAQAKHDRHIAEAIHALYGTPGDADEEQLAHWKRVAGHAREQAESQQERAEKAEALAESNASEADAAHQIANQLRAELERYKAALEAADAWMFARNDFEATEAARQEAEDGAREARSRLTQRVEQYRAARAAVEADRD